MSDNTTPHKAAEYSVEIAKTIPFHSEMSKQAIQIGLAVRPDAKRWLDTGAGPGTLAALLEKKAPHIDVWIADPAQAMLDQSSAKNKILASSQALPDMDPFDVITAVQCHHYGARDEAVKRCFELLGAGGVLVTFENVRAETDEGHAVQRARWADWQLAQGRDEETVAKHMAREGAQFHPIRPSEHLDLLERVGFRTVELFFRTYAQAGFYAVK